VRHRCDVIHRCVVPNEAVDDDYILGYSTDPAAARHDVPAGSREHAFLWHANCHPDGGQVFFPLGGEAFVAPLALTGDDVKPDDFVAFRFDGICGLYIHPGLWHEAVFPKVDAGRFCAGTCRLRHDFCINVCCSPLWWCSRMHPRHGLWRFALCPTLTTDRDTGIPTDGLA